MLRIAIVDDDFTQLELIKKMLFKCFKNIKLDFELYSFLSGLLMLDNLALAFDLVILDYYLPDLNGYETALKLREQDNNVKIIYLTANKESWNIGYKVSAYRYFLKPLNEEEFFEGIENIVKVILSENDKIAFEHAGGIIKIKVNDIIYVMSNGRKSNIYIRDNADALELRVGISKMESKLMKHDFIRPHISYCVNKSHICAMSSSKSDRSTYLVLSNGEKIMIARDRKKEIKFELLKYLEKIIL